jgi:hypothetical protein
MTQLTLSHQIAGARRFDSALDQAAQEHGLREVACQSVLELWDDLTRASAQLWPTPRP